MNEERIIEIIAAMKSNTGNVKQWALELEEAIGIEPMTVEITGNPI